MVYTLVLETNAGRIVGSNPTRRTLMVNAIPSDAYRVALCMRSIV